MKRIFAIVRLLPVLGLLSLFAAVPAQADPADIEAAARGVVRVIVIDRDGDQVFPVSHGSGFAVNGETIVTNAHVVREALNDPSLSIGIVPSDGGDAVYGRIVSVSPRNDLALVTATSPMHLPPLTIAGNPPGNNGSVTAIGFPMNVDQAQGLGQDDIFRAQPPVTSQGFLSGRRPSREFDTVLHTAPIARGNSGGPLVDSCGRVIGVNSFGAESEGTEAEFFFAVTMRELLPFLRANSITPRVNSMPCRSLAELDAAERERAERQQLNDQIEAQAEEEAHAQRRAELRRDIEFAVLDERANGMALGLLLFIVFTGGAVLAYDAHRRQEFRPRAIAGSVAVVALVGAGIAWLSRPAFDEVEERLQTQLREEMAAEDTGVITAAPASGQYSCILDPARSRVLGTPVENVAIGWDAGGCINQRSQYGLGGNGEWSRVFVPANEAAVSVNRFDPATGAYVVERYLLDSGAMAAARTARAAFEAPACGSGEEPARALGNSQEAILALLPQSPNERLVYDCNVTPAGDLPAG